MRLGVGDDVALMKRVDTLLYVAKLCYPYLQRGFLSRAPMVFPESH